MNWKERKLVAVVFFIIAYIITIPWRDYASFFDISQGITMWMHLTLIIAGSIVLLILMKVAKVLVKRFVLGKKKK